jgi:chromate transporter
MKRPPPAFREALGFWARLGWINFGGPAGQIAMMHRELVERRRWVDEASFLHGLNYCMLLPGPEAMQLATWLGWRLHGLRGGIAAGVLFVLPATVILAALAWVYLRFGQVPVVSGALFGVQAVVLAIIAQALLRIGGKVLRTPLAVALALSAWLAIALRWPFPLVIGGAAVIGLAVMRIAPRWLLPTGHAVAAGAVSTQSHPTPSRSAAAALAVLLVALWWLPLLGVRAWLGPDSTSWAMGVFFSKAALVTLGGAYAVLPYVAQQAVEVHGWVSPEQMLVGLGLAESTPGPLIMVLEFVGFVGGWQHPDLASPLASAVLGAAITVWATFLPSFLFVLPAAPWIERLRELPALNAALAAVTAAVVGAIANLALWFGWRLLQGQPAGSLLFALLVALVAGTGMLRWKWGVPAVVLAAAVAGAVAGAMGILRPA